MPTYGLKYHSQFHSQSDDNNPSKLYTLQFLFKDYSGGTTSIDGADTTVIQKCTTDDPVAPIKGQSLEISLLNRGNTPITAFQSEDDDGVQVKLLGDTGEVLFIGFLVQDDFSELMVDFTHTITLSANDSLGLLKGVILSKAATDAVIRRIYRNVKFRTNVSFPNTVYLLTNDTSFQPQAGNIIELQGLSYIISTVDFGATLVGLVYYNWTIILTTDTPGIAVTTEDIYLTGGINLLNRNTLLDIIAVCMYQTNLTLVTNIFMNLYEYRQDNTKCSFEQTLIDSQLFISGETYEDCYSVLTKILTSFNCTLCQANGQWNIVHWYEARRYANNAIPGFVYDETWAAIGTTVFNNNFFIGPSPQLTRPISGLTQGAIRGYKFSRKQFDYLQPKYLLKNYDLQTLGELLRTYTYLTFTIKEYVATGWLTGRGPILIERFIRIQYDNLGNEMYRTLVGKGLSSDNPEAISGVPIEAKIGDKIKFSFSFATNESQPGNLTIIMAVKLTDGTLIRYVNELPNGNGSWSLPGGFSYFILTGDNSNQWHTVTIESSQIPFNGMITLFLPSAVLAPVATSETWIRDIRFEYIPFVNDSTKITGQIHKQEQDVNKKLNSDTTIFIDDSPTNNIIGTLFLTTKTPNSVYGLQDRTIYWRYPSDATQWRLGEFSTLEDLVWKQKTRSKLEGGFIGNYQGAIISLLTMAITDFNTAKNDTFGLLSIDYKRNQFSGTLWEMYDTTDGDFDPDYEFKYIYSTT